MKAKGIITAIVRYYDMTLCNLQNELHAAKEDSKRLRSNEAELHRLRELSGKYDELEDIHTAAVTRFGSDTKIMQAELDKAEEEAKEAKQALIYSNNKWESYISALSCVTVDAVAHCNAEPAESLRAFIELVKEHAPLNTQGRIQLNSMLANLEQDF